LDPFRQFLKYLRLIHKGVLFSFEGIDDVNAAIDSFMEKHLTSEVYPAFRDALMYPIKVGGKRIRPILVMLSAEAAGGSAQAAIPAATAFELAHNGTLIFDDIIDRGELRRGNVSAWKKYGEAAAILIALRYREAIVRVLSESKHPLEIESLVSKVIDDVIEGEMLDISLERAGRDEPLFSGFRKKEVTVDDYLFMIRKKTASLFEGCCRAGAIVADAPPSTEKALSTYGLNLGYLFQITDDILDIFGAEEEFGKKIGKDIMEHKGGNIVILLGLQMLNDEQKRMLARGLVKESVTEKEVTELIGVLRSAGLDRESRTFASKYEEEMNKALRSLPETDARSMLEALPGILLQRRH